MTDETRKEFGKDLFVLYACHKTQLEIKNQALKELYIILELYMLTVMLYEFIIASGNKDELRQTDWAFLKKWRKRFLKKHASPGSATVRNFAAEKEIDFDHYFFDSVVTVNSIADELLGIDFGTHDLSVISEEDWKTANELIITVIGALESRYDRNTIGQIETVCRVYASVVENIIKAEHYHYASGVMFKHPEPCVDDKYLIMYYYTFLKLISMSDTLLPTLDIGDEGNGYRMFILKMKAEIIESFGECIKDPKTPLARDISIRINDHVDTEAFSLNRKLRNNLHYGHLDEVPQEELERIEKFQDRYFQMVIMSFDERLAIKVGRWYRVVMWIALHTDTETVKAKRQLRREQRRGQKRI